MRVYFVLAWLICGLVPATGEIRPAPFPSREAHPWMGDWEGRWIDPPENSYQHRKPALAAQVVLTEPGQYRIRFLEALNLRAAPLAVFDVRPEGERLAFDAGGWSGRVTASAITGSAPIRGRDTQFRLQRRTSAPPTLGLPPPPGAIVLFDGSDFDRWEHRDGRAVTWKLVDDAMEIVSRNWVEPGGEPNHARGLGGNIATHERFGSGRFHLEFRYPVEADKKGQGRGNSGVFLEPLGEIQILNSYGLEGYWDECGALYKFAPPKVNAAAPPLSWQTYDIEVVLPENPGGVARLTVHHNGHCIHREVPIAAERESVRLMLQDHNNSIQFRNIWFQPAEARDKAPSP